MGLKMTIGISLTLFFPLVFGGLLWAGEGVVSFQAVGRDGEVLLEVWARNLKDTVRPRYRQRYNVFHIIAKENPKWVCEADMGRGLILKESA